MNTVLRAYVYAHGAVEMRHRVFNEHDLLVLTRDVPEAGLEVGDVGVVVAVYDGGSVQMEFVSANGATLAVLTLVEIHAHRMSGAENLHLSGLAPVLHAPARHACLQISIPIGRAVSAVWQPLASLYAVSTWSAD